MYPKAACLSIEAVEGPLMWAKHWGRPLWGLSGGPSRDSLGASLGPLWGLAEPLWEALWGYFLASLGPLWGLGPFWGLSGSPWAGTRPGESGRHPRVSGGLLADEMARVGGGMLC